MAMNASADAANAARRAADHPWFGRLARSGYVANGILHGVLGALALVLATGGSAQADQSGAIQALASQPFGELLLWVCAAGSLLLGLWNISQALLHSDKLRTRIKFVSTGLVFLLTGGAFGRYAIGSGSDSKKTATSLSGELMGHPAGQIALIIFGATVIGIGGFFVFRGVTHRFLKDLKTTGGTAISPQSKSPEQSATSPRAWFLGLLAYCLLSPQFSMTQKKQRELMGRSKPFETKALVLSR